MPISRSSAAAYGAPCTPVQRIVIASGLAGVEFSQNFGVAITSGTPQAIVDRLNREINGVLAQEEIRSFILRQGAVAQIRTPAEWGEHYVRQRNEAAALAKRFGIEAAN